MAGEYSALEREVALLLRRGASLSREVAAQVHPDLDAASYSTLAQISDTAPARAADLVDYFGIDKAAVSRQVGALERLGLIERTADSSDARAQSLRLTAFGQERIRAVRQARMERFRALLRELPKQDVDSLARLLHILNRLL
jgi:DNA-binding MarR family transcriptional regulator